MHVFRALDVRKEAICELRAALAFPPEYAVISAGRQRLHALYILYQCRAEA